MVHFSILVHKMPQFHAGSLYLLKNDGTRFEEVFDVKTNTWYVIGEPGKEFSVFCQFHDIESHLMLQVSHSENFGVFAFQRV